MESQIQEHSFQKLYYKTLHFITPCNGYTFRLVQNDIVYYSIAITGNTLIIPSTNSGTYELQIVSGDIIFYTEVDL